MTGNLEGVELRKALLIALDWRVENRAKPEWYDRVLLSVDNKPHAYGSGDDHLWAHAPALESDPGVFWPEFEKWFRPLQREGDNYSCGFGVCHWFDIYLGGKRYNSCGDVKATQLVAGCRAWLAALEQWRRA